MSSVVRLLVYIRKKAYMTKVTLYLRSVNRMGLERGKTNANGGGRFNFKELLIDKR